MTDLSFDRDEAIVLESEEVLRLKRDGDYDELDDVILTNKKIYGSYEKSTSLFKERSLELYTWSLSDIKIINGQAQVQQITYAGELCLRIQLMQETVYLSFSDDPEETMLQWILEINKLLGTTAIIPTPKPPKEKKGLFARKRTKTADKSGDATPPTDDSATKPSADRVHAVTANPTDNPQPASRPSQPKASQAPKDRVCVNCRNKLSTGAIFCPLCGFKVTSTKDSVVAPPTPPTPPAPPIPPAPPTYSPPPVPPVKEKVNHGVKTERVEEKHDSDMSKKTTTTYTQRRHEYAGKIIKCPSCGEVLQSMTAICPACGYELNSVKFAPALKEFIDEINECDKIIANTPKKELPKKGWKSWKTGTRVLWVILNIFTSCIPLVIYLTLPLFRPLLRSKATPELSSTEQRKVALIENFIFPNDRESVLEALLFTKSKMAFLTSEKVNEKNVFWLRLWNTKATQLHQKATILLSNDTIAETAYSEILASKNAVDKKIRIRAGIGTAIVLVFLAFVLINGSLIKGVIKLLPDNSFSIIDDSDEKFEWLKTGLSTELPEIQGTGGHIWKNSEEELDIYIEGISYSQFDAYIVSCKEIGFTVDSVKDTDKYTAYNSAGYRLELQHWSSERLDINLKAPLIGDENFEWPSHAFADLIPQQDGKNGTVETANEDTLEIILYDVSSSEFKSYISECEDAGFTIDTEKKDISFNGFNAEGYELSISYNEMKAMRIAVKAPRKFATINWPSSGPAEMLPKPSLDEGIISGDYDWSFSVYIGNMTIADFNDYVDKCEDKGFVKDWRSDTYFSADKGEDISLTVEYVGFNTVHISITDYEAFRN